MAFVDSTDLIYYKIANDSQGKPAATITTKLGFLSAGGSTLGNSTTLSFPNSTIYSARSQASNVTVKENAGGLNRNVYVYGNLGYILLAETNSTGTIMSLIRIDTNGAEFEQQHFVTQLLVSASLTVVSQNQLKIFAVDSSGNVYKYTISQNAITTTYLFAFDSGTSSVNICAVDDTEVLLYHPTNTELRLYYTNGTQAGVKASSVTSLNGVQGLAVGCTGKYTSSSTKYMFMAYPTSHLSYTTNLFVQSPDPFGEGSNSTFITNGIGFAISVNNDLSIFPFLQQVTNFSSIFTNTSDYNFFNLTYRARIPDTTSNNFRHHVILPNASTSDRFWILSISTSGSAFVTTWVVSELGIVCTNPDFKSNEISREYYIKVGTLDNPDAMREKQAMLIVRKDSLTRTFKSVEAQPTLWIAVIFSLIAVGGVVILVLKAMKDLKNATTVQQKEGSKISYSQIPEPPGHQRHGQKLDSMIHV